MHLIRLNASVVAEPCAQGSIVHSSLLEVLMGIDIGEVSDGEGIDVLGRDSVVSLLLPAELSATRHYRDDSALKVYSGEQESQPTVPITFRRRSATCSCERVVPIEEEYDPRRGTLGAERGVEVHREQARHLRDEIALG